MIHQIYFNQCRRVDTQRYVFAPSLGRFGRGGCE